MRSPTRRSALIAGVVALSIVVGVQPASADIVTGVYDATAPPQPSAPPPLPPPDRTKPMGTGGVPVDLFYLVNGVITSSDAPSVAGRPVSNLGIDLSTGIPVLLFEPNDFILPPPDQNRNVLIILNTDFQPLAVFDINPADPGRADRFDFVSETQLIITIPVSLRAMNPDGSAPPADLAQSFISGGELMIDILGIRDAGSVAFPVPPFQITRATFTLTPVPEPGALTLCLVGAVAGGTLSARGRLFAAVSRLTSRG